MSRPQDSRILDGIPVAQRRAWGRLAVLRWFDPELHEFVVGDVLPFDLVRDSPFVQRIGGQQGRYRVRGALRPDILSALESEAPTIIRHTAGLAAAFLSPADRQYLGYVALFDPEAAQSGLATAAMGALNSGDPGGAVTMARDAVDQMYLGGHLGGSAGLERERLARFADVVGLVGALLTFDRGAGTPLGRARLLRIALSKAGTVDTVDEQRLFDLARDLSDRYLRATGAETTVIPGIDDWLTALAYARSHDSVSAQTHTITVTGGRVVHRIDAVVHGTGDAPVLVSVLPTAAGGVADGVHVHDGTGAVMPRLTTGKARHLITIADMIATRFPEPGWLARFPETADETWKTLRRARRGTGNRLDGVPVVALLPDSAPRALTLSYETPADPPSRWTGRTTVVAEPAAVHGAEQHVTISTPVGTRPRISGNTPHLAYGDVLVLDTPGHGGITVRYGLPLRNRVPTIMTGLIPLLNALVSPHPITAALLLAAGTYGALFARILAPADKPRRLRAAQILNLTALTTMTVWLIVVLTQPLLRGLAAPLAGASAVLGVAAMVIETVVLVGERVRRRPTTAAPDAVLTRVREYAGRFPLFPPPLGLTWTPDGESPRSVRVDDLADDLAHEPMKVHLLGSPGSGKTMLLCALADMLTNRSLIPVVLSTRTWHPTRETLVHWAVRELTGRLGRVSRSERATLTAFAENGELTLILDDLDELSAPARLEALRGIENAGPRVTVVAACRLEEYSAVSPAARGLSTARVVRIDPLPGPEEAVLPRFADEQVGDEFLTTYEAVELAAVVRAELRQSAQNAEQAFTEAAIQRGIDWGRTDREPPIIGQCRRWLRTIAVTARRTSHGFTWPDLHRTLTGPARTLIVTLGSAAAVTLAAWIGASRRPLPASGADRMTALILLLLATAVLAAAAVTPRKAFTGVRMTAQATGVALTVAAVTGPAVTTAVTVAAGWLLSWPVGGAIRRLISRRRVRQPLDARRSLRLALLFAVLEALLPLVSVSIVERSPNILLTAAVAGSPLPLLFSPWGWYRSSHLVLAARGALPWRLTRFLEDAAVRRILRHRGMGFDFRHRIYLQGLAPPGAAGVTAPVLNRLAYEVSCFFQRHPGVEFDDHDVCTGTGLMPSQTYPTLRFLIDRGWLTARWEERTGDRRRFYRLDSGNRDDVDSAIEEFRALHPDPAGSPAPRPRTAGSGS
ncbi:AAA family ATPase [Actinoplanes couchii]|uniref:AAA+ ATPase domain-containing protein n=1 Tax=Actinoplanes couchii TaxID=403638 RepID=A0ABQ3XEZ4_9ACTN|nr:AAA family ATPase [Actinoplanes couchii]MDR6319922.1 hypothetical protein [Actinoplanes couchii]GID57059.1 hypothetical protein Aco03nite_054630 [Actinoplanes couchii]